MTGGLDEQRDAAAGFPSGRQRDAARGEMAMKPIRKEGKLR